MHQTGIFLFHHKFQNLKKDGAVLRTLKSVLQYRQKTNFFFKCINNQLIVGKSNKDSDEYDSLYFVNSDERPVAIIPSFIKCIKHYAFSHCNSLDAVEFQPNSQLQTIESRGFARLHADCIVMPKSVRNICEFAFCGSEISVTEISRRIKN